MSAGCAGRFFPECDSTLASHHTSLFKSQDKGYSPLRAMSGALLGTPHTHWPPTFSLQVEATSKGLSPCTLTLPYLLSRLYEGALL